MTDKELRKRLGYKAKELRKKTNLTQKELAAQLGVHQGDLSAFESRGEKIGSVEKINELFNCLGYEINVTEKKTPLKSSLTNIPLTKSGNLSPTLTAKREMAIRSRLLEFFLGGALCVVRPLGHERPDCQNAYSDPVSGGCARRQRTESQITAEIFGQCISRNSGDRRLGLERRDPK